jgi:hypothetical protein
MWFYSEFVVAARTKVDRSVTEEKRGKEGEKGGGGKKGGRRERGEREEVEKRKRRGRAMHSTILVKTV